MECKSFSTNERPALLHTLCAFRAAHAQDVLYARDRGERNRAGHSRVQYVDSVRDMPLWKRGAHPRAAESSCPSSGPAGRVDTLRRQTSKLDPHVVRPHRGCTFMQGESRGFARRPEQRDTGIVVERSSQWAQHVLTVAIAQDSEECDEKVELDVGSAGAAGFGA